MPAAISEQQTVRILQFALHAHHHARPGANPRAKGRPRAKAKVAAAAGVEAAGVLGHVDRPIGVDGSDADLAPADEAHVDDELDEIMQLEDQLGHDAVVDFDDSGSDSGGEEAEPGVDHDMPIVENSECEGKDVPGGDGVELDHDIPGGTDSEEYNSVSDYHMSNDEAAEEGGEEEAGVPDCSTSDDSGEASVLSASSSSAPDMAADAHRDRVPRGVRGGALEAVTLRALPSPCPSELRFSPGPNNVCAHCGHHGPGCRMTRTLNARQGSSQGRPLGLLTAFLIRAGAYASSDLHKDSMRTDPPSFEERRDARVLLQGSDDSQWFLDLERPQQDDESECEPDDIN